MTRLEKLFLIQKNLKRGICALADQGIECMSGDEAFIYVALRGVENLIDEAVSEVKIVNRGKALYGDEALEEIANTSTKDAAHEVAKEVDRELMKHPLVKEFTAQANEYRKRIIEEAKKDLTEEDDKKDFDLWCDGKLSCSTSDKAQSAILWAIGQGIG
jgi:hypothetical protein